MLKRAKSALLASFVFYASNIAAQSVDKEHVAVVELGGAAFWSVTDARSSFGPSVAVEVTPVENWLELEVGTTPLFGHHSTEWGTDLVLKKPWDLSKQGGVYAWRRPGMGSGQAIRYSHELHQR